MGTFRLDTCARSHTQSCQCHKTPNYTLSTEMKINFDYVFFLFFVADLFLPSIEAKDYYKILAVPKSATEKQIKKAFREKARLLHPDKNDSPNAEQQFRELAEGKSDLISIIAEVKCITVILFF